MVLLLDKTSFAASHSETFCECLQSWRYNTKPPCYNIKHFRRQTLTRPKVFCKKGVLKASEKLQENNCVGVSWRLY